MNILVDIVHPADVLFFLYPIRRWQQLGHSVSVVSRRKDVTASLLDGFAVEHKVISGAGDNLLSMGLELVKRDIALLRFARQCRPDVMCGFGGVSISHVGKVLGIPSVSFYDTGRAPLQHRLTLPFISHLYVPESYDGPIAHERTSRFPGTKDFSYLHPDNFVPDHSLAMAAGLANGRRNYFVRLVNWRSNHDFGHSGWNTDTLLKISKFLSERGKVHISSERSLPAELDHYQYRGEAQHIHHLLACCDTYVGESATMASEAVLLGVPAIYAAADRRCYADELARHELLWKVSTVEFSSLSEAVTRVEAVDKGEWMLRRGAYLKDKINLAEYVVERVISHALIGV